jgi:hypothetical protein
MLRSAILRSSTSSRSSRWLPPMISPIPAPGPLSRRPSGRRSIDVEADGLRVHHDDRLLRVFLGEIPLVLRLQVDPRLVGPHEKIVNIDPHNCCNSIIIPAPRSACPALDAGGVEENSEPDLDLINRGNRRDVRRHRALLSRRRHRGMSQYRAFPGVRGNGIASRTLERPVT